MKPGDHLARRWLIDLWANGAVTIRHRDDRTEDGEPGGLPVWSTDTKAEAQALLVRHCKLSRQDHRTYFLPRFRGYPSLAEATERFRIDTENRRAGRPVWAGI